MTLIKAKKVEVEVQEQMYPNVKHKYVVTLKYEPEDKTSTEKTSDEDKSESAVVSKNRKTATEAADAFDTLFNN